MRPVPISKAKALAKELGAEGVAIFVFGDGQVGGTSYGADKNLCLTMGKFIDRIVDDLSDGKIASPVDGNCPWPRITQE